MPTLHHQRFPFLLPFFYLKIVFTDKIWLSRGRNLMLKLFCLLRNMSEHHFKRIKHCEEDRNRITVYFLYIFSSNSLIWFKQMKHFIPNYLLDEVKAILVTMYVALHYNESSYKSWGIELVMYTIYVLWNLGTSNLVFLVCEKEWRWQ